MFTYICSSLSEENFSLMEEFAVRLASSISGPLLTQPITLQVKYNRHLIRSQSHLFLIFPNFFCIGCKTLS